MLLKESTKESTSFHCEVCSHCNLTMNGDVCPEVVADASKCVGDCLAQQLRTLPACPENKTAFDASTEPLIAIAAYYARICTYSRITPETIICAYINLKKVCREHPQFELTNFNAHRLLVSSMMVFSKYYDDDLDSNARWARIAGVAIQELNCLEIDFLNLCQFDLRICTETFHNTVHELLNFHHHEPQRTQVPLFHPVATFYRRGPSEETTTTTSPTPSPTCQVMTTPKSRYSLSNLARHHNHHSSVDPEHAHDHSNHGDNDSVDSTSHHHRKKSLAVLMNLFHRHHHHGHRSSGRDSHHEDHHHHATPGGSHVHLNVDAVSTENNGASGPPSVSSRNSPTSPGHPEHSRGGGKMPRNHSTLSLSGLMHALSPSSKPFRKTHSTHPLEPEVDK